jgi:hypothetical protein
LGQITAGDDVASFEFYQLKDIKPEEMPSISMFSIIKDLIQREGTY